MDPGRELTDRQMTKELLYICLKNTVCQGDLTRMGV